MTTDRPYRRAMRPEDAIEELRRNAGTQFEPKVVDALVEVVRAGEGQASTYSDAVRAVMIANRPAASGLELSA
jgi:HD-GYP domain-containing protein (c-di-GMP phosphodiesterase class II)